MTWLADFVAAAKSNLTDDVREILWGRGASEEQIDTFDVGYLERGLPPGMDLPEDFVEWAKGGAKFNKVFVFPLTGLTGDFKGLQFRSIDRDVKGYMDFIVDKTEAVLFGGKQAARPMWEAETALVVEGVFDFFPVQRVWPQTTATLTARISDTYCRALRRFVKRVWMAYDNDGAGQSAITKFQREHGDDFEQVLRVKYPSVPMTNGKTTKDPAELWEIWGNERFAAHFRCIDDPLTTTTE